MLVKRYIQTMFLKRYIQTMLVKRYIQINDVGKTLYTQKQC